MKPVFKCDYCSKMGTEEEIREHEIMCTDNYDRRSCYTCMHKKIGKIINKNVDDIINGKALTVYECRLGKEIPEGKIFEFCNSYERKEETGNPLGYLFGDMFDIFGR